MYPLIRSILFRFDPEIAHELAERALFEEGGGALLLDSLRDASGIDSLSRKDIDGRVRIIPFQEGTRQCVYLIIAKLATGELAPFILIMPKDAKDKNRLTKEEFEIPMPEELKGKESRLISEQTLENKFITLGDLALKLGAKKTW